MNTPGAASPRHSRMALGGLAVAHSMAQGGNTITVFATPFYVRSIHGSATDIGLATIAATLPIIIGGPLSGVLVDRVGYRRSSIVADVVSGVTVLAIAILGSTDHLPLWGLLTLLCASGLFDTPGQTARTVLLPAMARNAGVPLERTVGVISGAERTAMLVAAPLGGVLVAAIGSSEAFYVNAALFAVSALLVAILVPRSTPAGGDGDDADRTREVGYWGQLAEGARFVLATPLLRNIAFVVLVLNAFDTARLTVLLPLYALDELGGAAAAGLISGALAGGSVVGSVLFSAWGHRLARRALFVGTFVITGGPLSVAFALGAQTATLLLVAAATGLAAGMLNPLIGTMRLELVPPHMLARVQTLMISIAWAGMPLGSLAAGIAADTFELRFIYAAIGIAYVIVALTPLASRSWHQTGDNHATSVS
ncbi:MFS transporter [Kocuria tytonis]|uniref:MFS transporter n=1 Tax=Kocuria tytonis TaxID=2054280 RepID=A0A495AAS9_9MICC|nr:MFS transporter [Kocuria tytonis]RKQ36550.1 MFS transporter [Kocuria tytonis]